MTQLHNATLPYTGPSILDMLEHTLNKDVGENEGVPASVVFGAAQLDIRALQQSVREQMDAGLAPAEMVQARAVANGARAAEDILQRLMA